MKTAGELVATQLAELISESSSTVALTGAGVSVPSGIPDFRTPGTGLWSGADPAKVAHIDAFKRDPATFWSFYRPRFQTIGAKLPNPAHRFLAELEERGLLDGVITQNIDRLHLAAGSRNLIEIHGSIQTSTCQCCGARFQLEAVEELFTDEGIAECSLCCGLVKPDVVLFGEMLSDRAMLAARHLAENADLMICIGSSLEVYPAAGLPELTLAAGGKVVLVTIGPTPFDDEAELKLGGDVVDELKAVRAALMLD